MIGSSPVAVARHVADALESCGVRYVIGGSLASSISGEPRSTLDVDIVVEMSEADVPRVVAALTPEFEVDESAVMRAVRSHASVNVFHRSTAIKVDLFIAGGTPLDAQQMERRQRIAVLEHLSPPLLAASLRPWLELYPEKVLFGTGALPLTHELGWEETAWLGVTNARTALAMALGGMIEDGVITRARAVEIARMVLRDNAVALYKLSPS